MAKKDTYFENNPLSAIDITDGTATLVGNIIDTKGYESLLFAIHSGTFNDADGTWVPKVEEGDDPALADAADVDTDFLIGTIAGASFDQAVSGDENAVKKIGYVGKKQYARLTLTAGGTTPDAVMGAQAILGYPLHSNIS